VIGRLLALAALLGLSACGEPGLDKEDWPAPSPALWEVSSAQGPRGWLFGTIHALPDGAEWRTPAIERALESSNLLVVEIADLASSSEAAASFNRVSTSPGLPPLLARLPAGKRDRVRVLLRQADMSEGKFAAVESWAAALILANAVKPYDNANGVDRALLGEAGRTVGLESYTAQFALFDTLAEEDQVQLLLAVADEARRGDGEDHVTSWLTGDMDALRREAEDSLLADAELREVLQTGRNRAWAVRIAELIEAGERPFVAVGAAHMLGAEGLPALLAARGYTVRRIQ
jgi:uncharacterized protein YbaP (TraB family)